MNVIRCLRATTVAIALSLSGQAAAKPAPTPAVHLTVEPLATGEWRATYRFNKAAPAWLFTLSAPGRYGGGAWRAGAWTVETEGVRLQRRGDHDVLTSHQPIRQVQVRFRPDQRPLATGEIPALTFSDGGLALFTGQFELVPLASAVDGDARRGSIVHVADAGPPSRIHIRAPGRRLLVQGRMHRDEAVTSMDAQTYVYMGEGAVSQTPAMAAVIDPGMPLWLATDMRERTARLLAWYSRKLGRSAVERPMLYAAWAGGQDRDGSLDGYVLDGLMVVSMRGGAFAKPSAQAAAVSDWFIAHETAHLWLGQTVAYTRSEDVWMFEGGADLLAVRAAQHLRPGYDARARIQESLDGCLAVIGPRESLSGAAARGKGQANYDCGAVLLLAAEGALKRRNPKADALDFWREILDRRRAEGTVRQADWLDAFHRATGDAALTGQIRAFLEDGVDNPRAFLGALLAANGVAVTPAPRAQLALL